MYVCMYVWMYAGIYAYMRMSECVCICRYAACMHVCMRAWMHLSPPVLSYPTYSVVSCPVCAVLYYVHVLFVLLRHVYKCV